MEEKVTLFDPYEYAAAEFEFLTGLGFRKEVKAGEVDFTSKDFNYVLLKDRYGESPREKLLFLPEGVEAPSAYIGLQYYLDDYWGAWRSAEMKVRVVHPDARRITICCILLKSHDWLLLDPKWMRDAAFLSACQSLQDWFQQTLISGRIPHAEEITLRLRNMKQAQS